MADFEQFAIDGTTYDVRDAKAARKGMYVGTCPTSASVGGSTVTMASSADKVVTVDTFPTDANNKPLVGTIIGVKYATSNTYKTDTENNKPEAPHRINVNDTGYIQIYYNNAALKSGTSANTLAAGYKNRYIYYQYDGTYWVWLSAGTDTNTTYAGYSFGLGLGVQNNSSASATITVTLSNYALATGGVTAVRFLYDVPANATMNINSKGAKSIYYKNSAITAGIIKAGDTVTFVYSGQYHLIAIDRWDDDIKAKANSADLATVATSGSYNDLSNKPTIPAAVTVDSSLTGSSQTNPVQGGAIYSALQGKEDRQQVIVDIQCELNYPIGFSIDGNSITGEELYSLCADPKKDVVLRINGYDNDENDEADYDEDILYHLVRDSLTSSGVQYFIGFDEFRYRFLSLGLVLGDEGSNIYFDADIEELDYLPKYTFNNRKINNKPLSSDITLTASDVGADTFVVNIEDDGNHGYTCDKTNAEIYAAWQAGRNIVAIEDSEYVYGLSYMPSSDTAFFTGISYEEPDGVCNISIHTSNNVQTVNKNYLYLQHTLESGTNIKTINNTSLLGSGNLTPSQIGVPSIANNLTTTTAGSVLDATQGKALKDTVDTKADKVTIVTVSTTGAVTQALNPNTFYDFTGSPTSLTLTLTSGTGLCIYAGKFTAGTGFSNLTLPSTVKVADGAPSIEAGGTYEFSIMENLILIAKEGE